MKLFDEVHRDFQTRASPVRPLLIVVATLGVGENIVAPERWTEKHPSAGLSDDRDVVIQCARSPAGIEYGSRAITERAVKRIFSSHGDRGWRGRFDLLLERRSEDKPVRCQIVFLGDVG